MNKVDTLSDLERAEYYKEKYQKRIIYTILVGMICFALGYSVAKIVDGTHPVINTLFASAIRHGSF